MSDDHPLRKISTRLLESLVIGAVVMYGTFKVIEYRADKLDEGFTKLTDTVNQVATEQGRQGLITEKAWEHIHDRGKHK